MDIEELSKSFVGDIWGPCPFRHKIIDCINNLAQKDGYEALELRSGIPVIILEKLSQTKVKKKYRTKEYFSAESDTEIPTEREITKTELPPKRDIVKTE